MASDAIGSGVKAGTLAARFALLSERLHSIETLPKPGDLYYAVKNDGEGTGWHYVASGVVASDIHDAEHALSTHTAAGAGPAVFMRQRDLEMLEQMTKGATSVQVSNVEFMAFTVPLYAILADRASQEERHTPECIANVGEREKRMVVTERDEAGKPTVWCDPCIAPLVEALNDAGIRTVASCCGHSHRPGSIALADGRWLVIGRDEMEWRRIEALFPVDINGEDRSQEERIREDERDRIYERALRHAAGRMPDAARAAAWLAREEDVMPPPRRARLRGGAS